MRLLTARERSCAAQISAAGIRVVLPGDAAAGAAWLGEASLPAGAVRPSVDGPDLDLPRVRDHVAAVARELPARTTTVNLVIPDAVARVRVVPIEAGSLPGRRARQEMVRWALRDLLPFGVEEARVDTVTWDTAERRLLLVVAARRTVLEEYESAVSALGVVVRTMPATLAGAWLTGDESTPRLAVYADERVMGCLLASGGTPLFHRTRRCGDQERVLATLEETLDYAADRLGVTSGTASLLGDAAGDDDLEAVLAGRSWVRERVSRSADDPRFDALFGVLAAAEAP